MWYSLTYTDDIPKDSAGYSRFWMIKIKPQYQDDEGLLAHELEHVRQFWRAPFIHDIRYTLQKSYRLKCEASAYKVQMASPGGISLLRASQLLATKYNLGISLDEAKKILTT